MDIRLIEEKDRESLLEMMRVFYRSPAVLTDGSEEIFSSDITACVGSSPYAEGYIFEENGAVIGYSMLAKSFSTEFGKPCVWIEDLYFKEAFRGKGLGSAFFDFLKEKYPSSVFRLEAEHENKGAINMYRKNGFRELPYVEMIIV